MNNISQLLSALLLFSLVANGQQHDTPSPLPPEKWKTYVDSICEIQYPSEWEENTSHQMGTTFILLSPMRSDDDLFRENVNFMIQDLQGEAIDLDLFVSVSEDQIETLITNGEITRGERIKDDSGEHHNLVYTGSQGMYNLRFEQYYWIKDGKAYMLTYTAEQDSYNHFEDVSTKIIDSFKLK